MEIEDLLADAVWVRRMARGLLADESLVDDVVQRTFMAAAISPPRGRAGARAWLGTVLRNFVRLTAREEKRRRLREQAVSRREAAPRSHDPLERAELRHQIAEAVLGLREPYRTTVILRFYEDWSPREIAGEEGVRPNTIRVRLKRALVILRERLDEAHGGDRSRWSAGMVVLAGLGSWETLRAGSAHGGGGDPSRPREGDLPGRGGAAPRRPSMRASRGRPHAPPRRVPRAVFPALAALLLLALLSILLPRLSGEDPESPSAADATAGETSLALRVERDPTLESLVPSAAQESAGTFAALEPPTLDPRLFPLRVVAAATGEPVAGAEVLMEEFDMRSEGLAKGRSALEVATRPFCTEHLGSTGGEGRLLLPRWRLAGDRLLVCAPGFREHRERSRPRALDGDEYLVELAAPLAARVDVRMPNGEPAAGLMLRIHGTRGSLLEGETDGDGAFEFPWEDHDHRIEVEAPGFASQVALAELPATAITLVPGDPIHGRVVDLRGRPVAGCEVKIRTATWRAEGLGVFTGPDGGFESPPLPLEGSAELTLIHPDHPRLSERVDLGGKRERELVLADGASVGGRVRGPDGSTVSEGRVLLIPANPGRFYVRDLAGAAIGPDGSFRAGPVAPGEYTLLVEHPELAPVEIDLGMIAAGEAPRLAVRLPRGTAVSGRVVTPDGAPASGVRLKLGSIVGDEIRGPVTESGIDGSFLFTGVPHLSPIARPGLPDIRWKRILDEARGAAAEGKGGAADGAGEALRALILEIQRPADLLWKNREEIPGFGIFGSRNTCRVRPGARRLELVVRPLEEQRERLFELIHPSGAPLRTVTNLVIVPPDDPGARRIIVFGGTDGNPAKLHDPGAIEGCLVAFLSRRHATSFVQVEMEMDGAAAPMPVLLEEPRRPPPRIALRDRGGAPVAAQPLLFTPLFEDVAPFAAIYLGTTDGEGEVTAPFLAQGRYRISIPAEEVETGRWRPQITTLPLEGTRALGILDLAAEGDGEVMMELPAP